MVLRGLTTGTDANDHPWGRAAAHHL